MKRIVAPVLLLVLTAAGCRIDEEIVVFSDGSGQYSISIGIKKRTSDEANDWPDLAIFEKQWSGIMAWSEPRLQEDEKWRYAGVTGYFEDINRLRIWKKRYGPDVPVEERKPLVTYKMEKIREGGRVTVRFVDSKPFQVPEAGQEPRGNYFSRILIVPGDVIEEDGVITVKGRSAGIRVDDALFQGVMEGKDEAINGLEAANRPMMVRWKKPEHTEHDLKMFRKKMAAARERWKTLRAEWKARNGK